MLPQDNDSGGFFVTVFTKTAPLASVIAEHLPLEVPEVAVPAAGASEVKEEADGGEPSTSKAGGKKKKKEEEDYLERPFTIPDPSVREQLQLQFGLQDTFPWHLLYVRSPKVPSSVYLLHPAAKLLVDGQMQGGNLDQQKGVPGHSRRLNIVNTGARIFDWGRDKKFVDWFRVMQVRPSVVWRCASVTTPLPRSLLLQSGAYIVAPYLRRRVVLLPKADLKALAETVGNAGVLPFASLSETALEGSKAAPHGPVVFLVRSDPSAPTMAPEGDPHGPIWTSYSFEESEQALVERLPFGMGRPAISGWVLGETLKTAVSVDDKEGVLAAIDRLEE